MQPFNEAEYCFMQDVREKRRTASGVHYKTGKKGFIGKMLFPTDFMNRKEKYNHRKAGKVIMSNMFDSILPMDEFADLEIHEQRNRMQYWRSKYTIKEIMEGMGIYNKAFYTIIDELGLPKDRAKNRQGKRGGRKKEKSIAIQSSLELETTPDETIQEIIVNGMHLVFNGTYSPEEVQRQLLKYATLLDGETDQFYIELKLVQKAV